MEPRHCDRPTRVLGAEAQVTRQREIIARLKANGSDTSEAKSLLSAMRYSLRLLKLHERREKRTQLPVDSAPPVQLIRAPNETDQI
jgi:hypothetical protein